MTSDSVIRIFTEITRIPRESGHEGPMGEYLKEFAKNHSLGFKQDKTGNVLISKAASKGKEGVPVLVLQAHQDMVCEKVSGSSHDFSKDPIDFTIEDGWMIAKETTLGADDGIGVAACLALLESDLPAGPLECLFTVSEETGMDGAMGLEKGFFTGKTLINLDSEDEGELFVGCAGGINTDAVFSYTLDDPEEGHVSLHVRIYNAIGGHSGDDINKGRANTIYLLARFICPVLKEGADLQMIDGGNKHNAIAREAEAVLSVPEGMAESVKSRLETYAKQVAAEYSVTDPDIRMECEAVECNKKPIAHTDALKLVACLNAVFHGTYAMSQDIPGLVETSNNLASVKMKQEGEIEVVTSQRSSVDSALDGIAQKVACCFELAGAKVTAHDRYPGWKPDLSSPILKECVASYRKLFGTDAAVKAIHAGLECGLFLEMFPGLDMISFGPTLRGVHAPGEKLDLASNEKFVKLLEDVVTNFGNNQ